MLWAKLKAAKFKRSDDEKGVREARKSLNVNEEYLSALRTKSYAEFFSKAKLFVNNEPSSPSYCDQKFSEILLEPDQDTIPSLLESAVLSKLPELKGLMLNYFDISAEASTICAHLLKNISHIQCEYRLIQGALDAIEEYCYSPVKVDSIVSKLNSFIILNNPFSNPGKSDFNLIHEKYSSVLHHLKSKRKKITRKIKLIKFANKATGICITAACSLIAVTAVVLAAHTLTAILMGPVLFSFPAKCFRKKLFSFRFLRSGFLTKVQEQLDVAAKGTYILNRDFDMMGRLVARLQDEIEHNKAMVQFCLDRKEDKFCPHLVKEIKKSNVGFQKRVEELEEHVYLCLVTINRARVLVVKEMMISNSSISCEKN
ncbi:hypothetical protein Patl1_08061 [Pistacia atlantica]|uniref:Uncharacterized protein n=1 Tax=Pistacia atlantica TaxID=434234 RepID=A0ACC1AHB2_9ROSI|nr:hypothetical protein Patl1_08061 [Pistacia atlantica]